MTTNRVAGETRAGSGGAEGKRSILGPVFVSAAVFPGFGQVLQGRWLAGICHMTLFGMAFAWFIARFLKVFMAYYRFAFDFDHATGEAPSARAILVPFAVSVLFYLVSLADTVIAARRQAAGERSRRPPPLTGD